MADTDIPRPRPTPLSKPFWAAARRGQLVLQLLQQLRGLPLDAATAAIRCHSDD